MAVFQAEKLLEVPKKISLSISKIREIAFLLCILALTLIPIVRLTNTIASAGVNVLSSDYIAFVGLADRILQGNYNWLYFPRNTFITTHFIPIPTLIELGVAYFFHWNTYVSLFIGFGLALVRLVLFYEAFTCKLRSKLGWLLLPALAFLILGDAAVDVFTFGQTSVMWGCCFVSLAIGVWSLTRFSPSWKTVVIMAGAGIVGSYSGAMGLLFWPVFLVGMLLLGYRQIKYYAVWLAGTIVAAIPYFYFLIWRPAPLLKGTPLQLSNLSYVSISAGLGWPLSNNVGSTSAPLNNPLAIIAGSFGLLILVILLILVFTQRRSFLPAKAAPSIMLVLYGLLSPMEILPFRGGIAPWYNQQLMIFWVGLAGLIYTIWINRSLWQGQLNHDLSTDKNTDDTPRPNRTWQNRLNRGLFIGIPGFCVVAILGIIVLYVQSNFSYEDKILFLRFRSPAAAACLREYSSAPTVCQLLIHQSNKLDLAQLGNPLKRNGLSVFSADQDWSLQGDFVLPDRVNITQHSEVLVDNWDKPLAELPLRSLPIATRPPTQGAFWSPDLTTKQLPWSHYQHLNLFLQSPNSVSWTLPLPSKLEKAEFETAIAFSSDTPVSPVEDGATCEIYIDQEGQPSKLIYSQHLDPSQKQWMPVTFSLKEYAGKTVSLRLTSIPGKNTIGDWVMFRYPQLHLKLATASSQIGSASVAFVPGSTANDSILDVTNPSAWVFYKMQPLTSTTQSAKWSVDTYSSMQYLKPLNVCLSDYSYLKIRMAVTYDFSRTFNVFYHLNNNPNWQTAPLTIPVYFDGKMHDYVYDLKLLSLDPQVCISAISLASVFVTGSDEKPVPNSTLEIEDVRFIHK